MATGDNDETNGRDGRKQPMLNHKTSRIIIFREEIKAKERTSLELSKVQFNKHQVLLLQQLQPHAAKILLQGMQKVLDRWWVSKKHPIGGGSRKNKRSPPSSKIKLPDLVAASNSSSNPSRIHDGQDLNLGFFPPNPEFRGFCEFIQLPHIERLPPQSHIPTNSTTSSCANAASISSMELLNGLTSSRELMTSFMSMPLISYPNSVFSSGFALQGDFKSNVEGIGSGYGNDGDLQGLQETSNGRLLFPFIEDLKQVSSVNQGDNQQAREQGNSTGYWSGMMGGAGSW